MFGISASASTHSGHPLLRCAMLAALACWLSGCGAEKLPSGKPSGGNPSAAPAKQQTAEVPSAQQPKTPAAKAVDPPKKSEPAKPQTPSKRPKFSPLDLAAELREGEEVERENAQRRPNFPRPKPLDDAKLAAEGIRKVVGKHLALYTDLTASPAVDELPEVFDQAYPQWCEYFKVEKQQDPVWQMRGFLLKDDETRKRFRKLDLISPEVPEFENGYTFNHEFFFFEQRSDYYRRHLMLHEGTHGFMLTHFGLSASQWYFEGTAELFGTHAWENKKLALRHFPRNREETSYHGRIKLVKEDFAAGQALSLDRVINLPFNLHNPGEADVTRGAPQGNPMARRTHAYAWCWASAVFLDGHSRYRDRFRTLHLRIQSPGLAGVVNTLYEADRDELYEEWQVFVAGLEYGYDLSRSEIDYKPGKPLPPGGATATVRTDRGWQSSELRLEAGKTYELAANGRYVVAQGQKPWECEPGGVTIRYYQGLPLGILLAAIRPEVSDRDRPANDRTEASGLSPFLRPQVVGRSLRLMPERSGTLYFKINDSAAELGDNSGALQVRVTAGK
jgi:hypothetical protein